MNDFSIYFLDFEGKLEAGFNSSQVCFDA